jgi:hypothetical protein
MSGKPKTIPSASRDHSKVSDSRQIPVPYDQNRASTSASRTNEAGMRSSGSDAPTDENFVNDDIIEENSHVIPPTRQTTSEQGSKGKPSSQ